MEDCNPRKSKINRSYLWIALFIVACCGCGSKKSAPAEEQKSEDTNAVKVRNKVLQSLRSSGVTAILHSSESGYNPEVVNDVSRTNSYLKGNNKGVAAANLGIYLSDLTYLMAFEQRDEGFRYFDACLRLSEFVGMKKQFSEAIDFGFNEIIAGDEKLGKSLNKVFKDATNSSRGDEFRKLHASALTGYYIEELYRLSRFLESYKSIAGNADTVFFKTLEIFVNQKNELNNLIAYFDHIDLKPQGISLYQDILRLQANYLAFGGIKGLNKTDPSLILQNKTLVDILNSILLIRTKIVEA
jgi:hypothetical protein